ncbi:MAG TPA: CDP-diacylglycerol--glycerol-3-phosphate 3-phosphatidyltransferase [Ignavibacteriales bacterium]|jgi:CDP-diacylglycerol--glycerol-3-phosphate 3-phosphatidyltransferase|nr:CDP-diacylglycerol--glycerol-3-phosphate 3-phosphatidyltransferase [Ignavibacteriales bacterium]
MILPNQLTTLRIILTPIFAYLFISDNPELKKISLIIFLIAALTDWYDGWLARKLNYFTDFGRFMDPLADKILTTTAFFCFVYLGILELWMVLIIAIRDIFVTLLRSIGEYYGEHFITTKVAKWKTAFQMIFLYYILILYVLHLQPFAKNYKNIFDILLNEKFIYYFMLLITLLTLYTGIHYFVRNRTLFSKIYKKLI